MIRRPGAIVALLTGLNFLNYLDRFVLAAVLPPVMAELHLTKAQAGLLATVFLVGFSLTAPIFGALGDRIERKGLPTVGVLVWCIATVASGLSRGFWSLMAARALIGVGEASFTTLAPTLIDDVTPPNRRERALSIFYVATSIGSALGYVVGGTVEKHWGWRSAFFVAGGPGVVLALACLAIAEPARTVRREPWNMRRDIGQLVRIPTYRRAVLGYCAYTAAIGSFAFWGPTFIFVRHGVGLAKANNLFGTILVIGGAIGTLLGGQWASRTANAAAASASGEEASTQSRIRSLLRSCALSSAIGAPLALAAFLAPTSLGFFAIIFFAVAALFLCTAPINAVLLRAVPNELRASAMALSIFAIHVLGDLWMPALVGWIADAVTAHASARADAEAFGVSIAILALPLAIAVSAWLWWPRRNTHPNRTEAA